MGRGEIGILFVNEITVPMSGILNYSFLRVIININQAESGSVTFGPFEIISKTPNKIAVHVNAFLPGF